MAKRETWYLSGPMTGMPDYNEVEFNKWEKRLLETELDVDVFNPLSTGTSDTLSYTDYLRIDTEQILKCSALFAMPGWEQSVGASYEVTVAIAIGIPVYELVELPDSNLDWDYHEYNGGKVSRYEWLGDRLVPKPEPHTHAPVETILQEADRIVATDRQADYGHPIEDFTRTGRIWAAILGVDEVTPEQVGLCMAGLKISREVNKPKRDNRVDAAGYIKTVDLVVDELERRRAAGA